MKLIELLKIELPKRGGWPVEAQGVVQDKSGQIWFYKDGKPYCNGVFWAADPKSHDFDWVNWDFHLVRSEDYATEIVTCEQYEETVAETITTCTKCLVEKGKKDTGGSAFPYERDHLNNDGSWSREVEPGQTLRDYFAAKALQGILSSGVNINVGPSHIKEMEGVAKTIYLMADTMLKVRGE